MIDLKKKMYEPDNFPDLYKPFHKTVIFTKIVKNILKILHMKINSTRERARNILHPEMTGARGKNDFFPLHFN